LGGENLWYSEDQGGPQKKTREGSRESERAPRRLAEEGKSRRKGGSVKRAGPIAGKTTTTWYGVNIDGHVKEKLKNLSNLEGCATSSSYLRKEKGDNGQVEPFGGKVTTGLKSFGGPQKHYSKGG